MASKTAPKSTPAPAPKSVATPPSEGEKPLDTTLPDAGTEKGVNGPSEAPEALSIGTDYPYIEPLRYPIAIADDQLPMVAVLILTYERHAELSLTLQALRARLVYPPDRLRFYIADDASPSGTEALEGDPLFEGVTWLVNEINRGWGFTVNQALKLIHGDDAIDFVYFTEDDYVLTQNIDLVAAAAFMQEKRHVGLLRFRGTAGAPLVMHQFEADISAVVGPDWHEGEGSYVAGRLTYLQLDGHSPSAYLYSNGPHLRSKFFTKFYGYYSEGRQLGDTEEEYAIRVKGAMQQRPDDAPGIAILPDFIPMRFKHIGTSYQLTDADKGAKPGEPTGL